jgi:hypothetical protein
MPTAAKVERTPAECEADARKITCKICHAPVGVGCVSIKWEPEDGKFEPYIEDRPFHPKRLQWYDKHIERYGKVH